MKETKMLKDYPDVLKQWDYELNSGVSTPEFLPVHSNKQYYWKCKEGHPSYLCSLDKKTIRKYGCPVCSNHKVIKGINDFKSSNPQLMLDWDYELNEGIDPESLSLKSITVVNWKCHICGNKWKGRIRDATKKVINCPACSLVDRGHKKHIAALKKNGGIVRKDLLQDWDYSRNQRGPDEYSPNSNEVVFWKCHICAHEWKSKVSNRSHGRGCPCCSNRVLVQGINDLQTTHPDIANEWDYKLNFPITPRDVMHGTAHEYYWICPNGHEPYLKSPNKRTSQNSGCPECNKGRQSSFAERALFYYVQQMYPDAINRYKNIFNNGMELDVYIPSLSLAIEYDGIAFHKKTKLEREQRKYHICQEHKIKLLRIKEEDIEGMWLTQTDNADEIFHTDYDGKNFDKLEDTIRWVISKISFGKFCDIDLKRDETKIRALSPAYLKKYSLAALYPEIAKEWHPTKNGNLLPNMFLCGSGYKAWWLCPKCGHEWQREINSRVGQKTGCKKCYLERIKTQCPNNKTIYQYSIGGDFIKEWRSLSFAARELHINISNISTCAKGKKQSAGGFKWSYCKKPHL